MHEPVQTLANPLISFSRPPQGKKKCKRIPYSVPSKKPLLSTGDGLVKRVLSSINRDCMRHKKINCKTRMYGKQSVFLMNSYIVDDSSKVCYLIYVADKSTDHEFSKARDWISVFVDGWVCCAAYKNVM